MGHVRMMAACQPFLSGAISKTVNLPETATVEEIAEVYLQGWKLGLKALAVYRDNCKVGQPLSDGGSRPRKRRPRPVDTRCTRRQVEKVEYRPVRKRLPKRARRRPSRSRSAAPRATSRPAPTPTTGSVSCSSSSASRARPWPG
jgi:ribonucleoside-diphosphate reductase alpha chain